MSDSFDAQSLVLGVGATDTADDANTGTGSSAIACINCRKSHRRCDKILPSCTECKLRNVECFYNEPKKRGPRSGSMKNATRQQQAISLGSASDDEEDDDSDRLQDGEKKRLSAKRRRTDGTAAAATAAAERAAYQQITRQPIQMSRPVAASAQTLQRNGIAASVSQQQQQQQQQQRAVKGEQMSIFAISPQNAAEYRAQASNWLDIFYEHIALGYPLVARSWMDRCLEIEIGSPSSIQDAQDPVMLSKRAYYFAVLACSLQRLGFKDLARKKYEQARQIAFDEQVYDTMAHSYCTACTFCVLAYYKCGVDSKKGAKIFLSHVRLYLEEQSKLFDGSALQMSSSSSSSSSSSGLSLSQSTQQLASSSVVASSRSFLRLFDPRTAVQPRDTLDINDLPLMTSQNDDPRIVMIEQLNRLKKFYCDCELLLLLTSEPVDESSSQLFAEKLSCGKTIASLSNFPYRDDIIMSFDSILHTSKDDFSQTPFELVKQCVAGVDRAKLNITREMSARGDSPLLILTWSLFLDSIKLDYLSRYEQCRRNVSTTPVSVVEMAPSPSASVGSFVDHMTTATSSSDQQQQLQRQDSPQSSSGRTTPVSSSVGGAAAAQPTAAVSVVAQPLPSSSSYRSRYGPVERVMTPTQLAELRLLQTSIADVISFTIGHNTQWFPLCSVLVTRAVSLASQIHTRQCFTNQTKPANVTATMNPQFMMSLDEKAFDHMKQDLWAMEILNMRYDGLYNFQKVMDELKEAVALADLSTKLPPPPPPSLSQQQLQQASSALPFSASIPSSFQNSLLLGSSQADDVLEQIVLDGQQSQQQQQLPSSAALSTQAHALMAAAQQHHQQQQQQQQHQHQLAQLQQHMASHGMMGMGGGAAAMTTTAATEQGGVSGDLLSRIITADDLQQLQSRFPDLVQQYAAPGTQQQTASVPSPMQHQTAYLQPYQMYQAFYSAAQGHQPFGAGAGQQQSNGQR